MDLKKIFSALKETILEQFFPVTCPFCGKVISFRLDSCEECRKNLSFLTDVCERCGKRKCICDRLVYLDRVFAPFVYEGSVEFSIHRFKFQGHPEYATVFARYIVGYYGLNRLKEDFDCIAFVPMIRSHQRERGYNQAEELAKAIGNFSGLPVLSHALIKTRKTPAQHFLSYEERIINLSGAFSPGNDSFSGKRVLLCDDVYTTGTTLNECSRVLKNNGAVQVTGAVIASAQ